MNKGTISRSFISVAFILIAAILGGLIANGPDADKADLKGASYTQCEPCIKSLRQAIEDMIATYGAGYPKGGAFLEEIDKQLDLYRKAKDNKTKAKAAYALFMVRREALVSNPLVTKNPILFVVRHQYAHDHHNTHTAFPVGKYDYNGPQGTGPSLDDQFVPGATLKMIDLREKGKVTVILDTEEGVVRDPDVHWDGRKIVFSWKKKP